MIRYDDHAEFQLARRGIKKAWVDQVLNDPDLVDLRDGANHS